MLATVDRTTSETGRGVFAARQSLNGHDDGTVVMPRGLIGFEGHRRFIWDRPADPRFARFGVLRSIEDAGFSLFVLPLAAGPLALPTPLSHRHTRRRPAD